MRHGKRHMRKLETVKYLIDQGFISDVEARKLLEFENGSKWTEQTKDVLAELEALVTVPKQDAPAVKTQPESDVVFTIAADEDSWSYSTPSRSYEFVGEQYGQSGIIRLEKDANEATYKTFATQIKPVATACCDCGAVKTNTTHSDWCSTGLGVRNR